MTESRSVVARDWEEGQGSTPKGHEGALWGDGGVLCVYDSIVGVVVTRLDVFVKNLSNWVPKEGGFS